VTWKVEQRTKVNINGHANDDDHRASVDILLLSQDEKAPNDVGTNCIV